ncbi:MAG: hypothetical protein L6R42_000337, partial [Xanthoria sp. 1 TBL-2021]
MPPRSNDPSKNAFESLREEEDKGNFVRDLAAGLNEAVVEEQEAVSQRTGDKRPAQASPQGQPAAKVTVHPKDMAADLKARIARLKAQKAPETSQDQGPLQPEEPPLPEGDDMDLEPEPAFPYSSIPAKATWEWCAFGYLDKSKSDPAKKRPPPILLGSAKTQEQSWGLSIKIDAGRYGFPAMTLRLDAARTPTDKAYKREAKHDSMTYGWELPIHTSTERGPFKSFEITPLAEWLQTCARPAITKLPQIIEANKPENRPNAFVIRCQLRASELRRDFDDPKSEDKIPQRILKYFRSFEGFTILKPVDFLVVTPSKAFNQIQVPLFIRRINERVGSLSQYWDANGNYLLNSITTAPPADKIGGGVYLDNKDGSFAQLPVVEKFDSVQKFQTYMGITAVREAQQIEAAHIGFNNVTLQCFVKRILLLGDNGKVTERNDQFFVYVRLPEKGELKNITPEANLLVSVEWLNGVGEEYPPTERKSHLFTGFTVWRPASELAATGTDFCFIMQKDKWQIMPPPHRAFEKKNRLPLARMTVSFNAATFSNQLSSVHKFCQSKRPQTVAVRNLLMSGQKSGHTFDVRNPSTESPYAEAYDRRLRQAQTLLNPSQASVIEKMSHITDCVASINGPPGTGKTEVATFATWTALEQGQKILFCAPSNAGLDNAASRIWEARPRESWLQGKKLLRMESGARQRMSLMDEVKHYQTVSAEEEEVKFTAAYAAFVAENEDNLEALEQIDEILGTQQLDRQQVLAFKQYNRRASKLPDGMKLSTHVKELTEDDKREAEEQYATRRAANPTAQDIPDVHDTNKSQRYLDFLRLFNQGGGRIKDKKSEREFFTLQRQQERRAIANADIIFVTLDTVGDLNLQEMGFNPTMIYLDEAGQASLPAFTVPLTKFSSWEACMLFGDWKQLQPTITARQITEAFLASLVSPLEAFDRWKDNTITLNLQYRMAPAISQFVAGHVYDGELMDAPGVVADHPLRKTVREVTESLGILPGVGSELMWYNVPMSTGQREPGGFSLQNYGNAAAVNRIVQMLHQKGVPADSIVILTIYKAQIKLLTETIENNPDGSRPYREIGTSDSFQGKQGDIVIADYVIGETLNLWGLTASPTAQIGHDQYAIVTSFARDFHRLNVSLTRAKYGLFIVAQLAIFMSRDKQTNKLSNTMVCMAEDAKARNLVFSDWDIQDKHPTAIADREKNAKLYKEHYDVVQ